MKKRFAKRLFAASISLVIALSAFQAFASDLEVVMIGPDSAEQTGSTSLDDMKLGTSYTIDGYAIVTPKEFLTVDYFAQFGENEDYTTWHDGYWNIWQVAAYSDSGLEYGSWRFRDATWMESGDNAQFIWLSMDITNMEKKAVNYAEEISSIKVFYQDDYEFTGWIRQIDPDLISKDATDYGVCRLDGDRNDYPNVIVLNPEKMHPIDMLYTGHYVLGCTLPTFVINDKKSPLRMEIKMGGNELTYNIIK